MEATSTVRIRHEQGVEDGVLLAEQYADPSDSRRVTHVKVRFADRTISTWPVSALEGCQHCYREVVFGQTEQGFRGFVHVDTGKAACK